MARLSAEARRRIALEAGAKRLYEQDKVWSRYSNDKVDIAAQLGKRIIDRIRSHLLAKTPGDGPTAAIYAVLMASRSDDPNSTTWLYNHFAGLFFGVRNDQDLRGFAAELREDPAYAEAQILVRSTLVDFFVDDFERFMSVVWMILLYPNAHDYTPEQRVEITEHVYRRYWLPKRPMVQVQDHVVVYQGAARVLRGRGATRMRRPDT